MPCPAGAEWMEIASGVTTGPEAERLLLHASECQSCSKSLQDALSLLSDSDSEEDGGRPLTVAARDRLALRMTAVHRSRRPYRWSALAAVAMVVVTVAAVWVLGHRPNAPLAELASVYGSYRPFELRIDGAPNSEVKAERGATLLSSELLAISARVRRHRETAPNDIAWLHAQGRADLLSGRFEDAVAALQQAVAAGGSGAELLLDLASAQAMRGDELDRPLALINQALEKKPGYPAALFNRSLVYERMGRKEDAIRDLEECMRLETDPGWRDEAWRRAEKLRK